MIQLAQWGAVSNLDEATAAIFAKDFDAKSATRAMRTSETALMTRLARPASSAPTRPLSSICRAV